jgi:hypothetical protein
MSLTLFRRSIYIFPLINQLHKRSVVPKTPVTMTVAALDLAYLGDTTQVGLLLFVSRCPRKAW